MKEKNKHKENRRGRKRISRKKRRGEEIDLSLTCHLQTLSSMKHGAVKTYGEWR
jgi:hypothetical protein